MSAAGRETEEDFRGYVKLIIGPGAESLKTKPGNVAVRLCNLSSDERVIRKIVVERIHDPIPVAPGVR